MGTTSHAEILRLLLAWGSATVSDIRAAICASEATVRRDLDRSEAEDVVERAHGERASRPSRGSRPPSARARESGSPPSAPSG